MLSGPHSELLHIPSRGGRNWLLRMGENTQPLQTGRAKQLKQKEQAPAIYKLDSFPPTVYTPGEKHMFIPAWVIKTQRRLETFMNGPESPRALG